MTLRRVFALPQLAFWGTGAFRWWLRHLSCCVPEKLAIRYARIFIPGHQVYALDMNLPVCSPWELQQMVGFELTRLTPFLINDIQFHCKANPPAHALGSHRVEIWVVRRAVVKEAHQRAAKANIVDYDVVIMTSQGDCHVLERRRSPETTRFRLGVIALFAALVIVWLWAVSQRTEHWHAEAETIRRKFTTNQTAMVAARLARDRLDGFARAIRQVDHERISRPVLLVLGTLARTLPDGAWVEDFSLRGNEIRLVGYADDATAILQLLAAEPRFVDVHFGAPATKNAAEQSERFDITLRWKGES